jgi:NAD(P)-dependent dehydrogenase (short-subunit alcohol dehydrogenase family)
VLKLALDVTSNPAIHETLSATVAKFGRLDIVINNAGYVLMGDTEVIPESDARLQLDTNFWGPALISQEAVRIFREVNPAGAGGTIVQISSIGGYMAFPGSAFYHAGKFALGGFTEAFAKEMNPDWRIRFLVVAPGGIKSNFGSNGKFLPRHPAYDTPDGPLNRLLTYMMDPAAQASFSEADDCAKVLFDVLVGQDERRLPGRLLLGPETLPLFGAEMKKTQEEMEAWRDVTVSTSSTGGAKNVPIL